jgi:hypothetical protein
MKTKLFSLMLMLLLFAIPTIAFAQEDDTNESPTENACYVGGSMEGKCDLATEDETRWAWTCGWYIARVDSGVWGEDAVPDWCNYYSTGWSDGLCYYLYDTEEYLDFKLAGPINTIGNMRLYGSGNGTCQGLLDFSELIGDVEGTPLEGVNFHHILFIVSAPEGATDQDVSDACMALSPFAVSILDGVRDSVVTNMPDTWHICLDLTLIFPSPCACDDDDDN